MLKFLKNYSYIAAIIAIMFFGFAIRFYTFISAPSFWFDESALGYNILTLKYGELFGILHLQQVAPPLFLVTTKFLTTTIHAGDSILRLFPFIVGNLCIIMFFLMIKNIFTDKIAIIWGLILFCFNTQLIWYSIEFKPYIVEVFSTCLLFYLFKKIDWNWSLKKFVILGLSLSLLPWFAFVSSILLFIGEIIIFSKSNLKKWLTLFLPTLISTILLLIYTLNIKKFYYNFMEDFFIYNFLNFKVIIIQLFFCICYLFSMKYAILPLILLIAGAIYCAVNKKYTYFKKYSFFLFLSFFILSLLKVYPFFDRFILFLIPLVLITMLAILEVQNNYTKFIISLLLTIFLLFPTFLNLNKLIKNVNVKGDYAKELTKDLSNKIKADDIIYVDNLSVPDFLYYTRYYKFHNKIYLNVDIINDKILYKPDSNKEDLNKYKPNNVWIYAPWAKNSYSEYKYDYKNIYYPKSQLIYIKGN